MRSGTNWYKTGNKTCHIPNVNKFYVEKGYICQQAWKCHLWYVNVCFRYQNIIQKRGWGAWN